MIITFETKSLRKLGLTTFEKAVVFTALCDICKDCEVDYVLAYLKKELRLNEKKIGEYLREFVSLGLVEINENKIKIVRGNLLIKGLEEQIEIKPVKLHNEKIELNKNELSNTIADDYAPVADIISLYNSICKDLSKVMFLTRQRIALIRKRYKEFGLEKIKIVFEKVAKNDFLGGKRTNWRANFDWIMKRENFIKILEGYYDNENYSKNNNRVKL